MLSCRNSYTTRLFRALCMAELRKWITNSLCVGWNLCTLPPFLVVPVLTVSVNFELLDVLNSSTNKMVLLTNT